MSRSVLLLNILTYLGYNSVPSSFASPLPAENTALGRALTELVAKGRRAVRNPSALHHHHAHTQNRSQQPCQADQGQDDVQALHSNAKSTVLLLAYLLKFKCLK